MKDLSAAKAPRRAIAAEPEDEAVVPESETQILELTPTRRGRRAARFGRLSRSVVAATLATLLIGGGVVGYVLASRSNELPMTLDADIPQEAVEAATKNFTDRAEEADRNAIRSSLTEAVADEAAREREAELEANVDDALGAAANQRAQERDAQLAADLELVAAQAEKLKKEQKAAAARFKKLQEAAKSAGLNVDGMSAEEIEAIISNGGSMPLKSGQYSIGAGFGATGSWSRYHTGQDFSASHGTPVYAAASGIILSPTAGSWAGTNVVIQHTNGGATLYAHLSQRVVQVGQVVKVGQLIGYVGNTGRSFGPHLHFEYYQPGVTPGDVYSASNPLTFLRSLGVNI